MDSQILNNTQRSVIKKLPIAKTLKSLQVGESTIFPICQYDALYCTARRARDNEQGIYIINRKDGIVTVRRTA